MDHDMHGRIRLALVLVVSASAVWTHAPADEPPPAPFDEPTDTATDVPPEFLAEMAALLQPQIVDPQTERDHQEAAEQQAHRWQGAIHLGYEGIERFDRADNLAAIRQMMLTAAHHLHNVDPTEIHRAQLVTICHVILDGQPTPADALPADAVLTSLKLAREGSRDAERLALLHDLMGRYANTDAEPGALINATALALRFELADAAMAFADVLQANHADNGVVARFLSRLGRPMPFRAELTALDGRTIRLPDDLLGKIVVVEFWAAGCPQSRRSRSPMLHLYQTYHPQGVEFVGISIDPSGGRDDLREFIREHQLNWIQTFSGLGADDPTFVHYGIEGTPSIWVLNRQGFILTDNALEDRGDRSSGSTLGNVRLNIQRAMQQNTDSDTDD